MHFQVPRCLFRSALLNATQRGICMEQRVKGIGKIPVQWLSCQNLTQLQMHFHSHRDAGLFSVGSSLVADINDL